MKLYTELAEYYYEIEKSGRKFQEEVLFLDEIYKKHKVHSVLDIGCGTGEHVVAMQELGYKITGTDSSKEMISHAQKRFPNCHFEIGELQTYKKEKAFDGIYSIFGTMNYLITKEDLESSFSNIRKNLKPSGIIIMEIWNAIPIQLIQRKPLTTVGHAKIGNLVIKRNRGFKVKRREGAAQTEETLVEVNFVYNLDKKEIKDKHIMRVFTLEEISAILENQKLDILQTYGNYKMEKYKNHGARMLIVAKKR
ncbi:MAG: class I SAM-dependent methyltransferase [Leptospiraceae bacterium]|jgi:SAM-dependent methyltransferase|nr:class I SAM-dependent methyltransferase [Leptospiraceae bacterium]